MNDIGKIIDDIEMLKPIPPVAARILALADDPNSSMSEIADLIIHDPSITANLLRVCNSAHFSPSRRVESVRNAITLLGLDLIVDLVLLNSISENLKIDQEGYGLGEGELWRHAVLSAHVTQILAKNKDLPHNKHLLFTAALLKDIGKLILGRFVAFSFERINILVHSQGYSFNEAEKKIIGINHEELGALMAEKWRFSEKLIYIIRHHHLSDQSARDHTETSLVYLSDIVCMLMGIGTGVDSLSYRYYSDVLKRMTLTGKDLQTVINEIHENWDKIESLLNLV